MSLKMHRREFLRTSALAAAGLATGLPSLALSSENSRTVTYSGYPFEHVKALIDGNIDVPGYELHYAPGKISDLNTHVFSGPRTLGFTEIGLLPFMLAYANDDFRDYSLLPVFPYRTFRHRSIFIHADRGIDKPEDLKGRRVGTPGYSSTSLTWIRGMLEDEYGVSPTDIEWVVSSTDSSAKVGGKVSKQENVLPDGIRIEAGPPGVDESDLLLSGDVDALFHAVEPKAFVEGNPKVKRLFSNPRQTEQAYFRKTGLFPIMHAVAVRKSLVEENPALPTQLFAAYTEAKQRQYGTLDSRRIYGTLPWNQQELESTRELMGKDFWPYGFAANQKALDTLCRYASEQGLANRRLSADELFEPSTLDT